MPVDSTKNNAEAFGAFLSLPKQQRFLCSLTKHSFILPSDFSKKSREWFFPSVHLDDPDASYHFIHDANSVVSKDCCSTPAKKQKQHSLVVLLCITVIYQK